MTVAPSLIFILKKATPELRKISSWSTGHSTWNHSRMCPLGSSWNFPPPQKKTFCGRE